MSEALEAVVWSGILLLFLAAVVVLVRRRDRTRVAEARVPVRERELGAVQDISAALARARDAREVAAPLARQVAELLGVGFVGSRSSTRTATRHPASTRELAAEPVGWWEETARRPASTSLPGSRAPSSTPRP